MISFSDELRAALTRIDELKQQLDAVRPTLTPDVLGRVFQKFRLDWNYHSNSIEGNSLTFGETVAFLMQGVTAKGKPLKDHLDLRGHDAAIEFLLALVKDERGITEADIRELHKLILVEPYPVRAETAEGLPTSKTIQLGQYKTMPNHVRTGTGAIHYYATPEETPAKMQELMTWYRANRETLHPLVLAARFHHRFVAIHPFDDGNGRMTRLLTNLLLMQAGFPVVVVKTDEKSAYYGVLSQADAGVEGPLLEFFAERLIRSLELYLRGARGADIADEDDLDKEILLLKASVAANVLGRRKLDKLALARFMETIYRELAPALIKKHFALAEMFFHNKASSKFTAEGTDGETHELSGLKLNKQQIPDHELILQTAATLISSWEKLQFDKRKFVMSFTYKNLKDHPPEVVSDFLQEAVMLLSETHISITFNSSQQTLIHYYNEPFTTHEINFVANAIFRPVIEGIRAASA